MRKKGRSWVFWVGIFVEGFIRRRKIFFLFLEMESVG